VRDGSFQQGVARLLQVPGWGAVGLVFGQGPGDEPEGVLDLPVGQLVRPVLPRADDAEAFLIVFGQACERLADAGQVGRPAVGQREHQAGQ